MEGECLESERFYKTIRTCAGIESTRGLTTMIWEFLENGIGRLETFLVLSQLILSLRRCQCQIKLKCDDVVAHQQLFEQLGLLVRQLPMFWRVRCHVDWLSISGFPARPGRCSLDISIQRRLGLVWDKLTR